jgi:hypothetical protein
LDERSIGLYAAGQMMNVHLYGQISFTSFLSNGVKLKLGNNQKQLLVEIKVPNGKDIAKHEISPPRVIPGSLLIVSYAQLLIIIHGHCRDLMKMKVWWMGWQVGKRLTVVFM